MSTLRLKKPITYYVAEGKQLNPLHMIEAGVSLEWNDLQMMKIGEEFVNAVSIKYYASTFYLLYEDLDPASQKMISRSAL